MNPQNLLLFDGVCHLCSSTVQFILKHDPSGVIHFCSIQSDLGRRLYTERGFDPDNPEAFILITPRGTFARSDAALEIARLLGGVWRLVQVLKLVPTWLRDRVYLFIARHRYRWFGKEQQCMLPNPEWRDRFVEQS